tara:strand:- start:917 stop:1639 length:723 start_codon:yes stop_codon:yes gene_type:complete
MPYLGSRPDLGSISEISTSLTIGDGTAEDVLIKWDGNAVDYHLGLDDSADDIVFGKGSSLGTTAWLSFDEDGNFKEHVQSSFDVARRLRSTSGSYVSATLSGWDGSGSTPYVNTQLETEHYDLNADYNTSSYVFTAPVTGSYFLQAEQRSEDADKDNLYMAYAIVTSNRNYEYRMALSDAALTDDLQNVESQTVACVADMDAGDTAYPAMYTRGSTDSSVASGAFNSEVKAFHMFGYLIG